MNSGWGHIGRLAGAGALGFWVANLAISLTPIAAEYRNALSIPYVPMLVEALLGGFVIALGVTWTVVRHPDALPAGSAMVKSLLASLIALIAVTVVIEVPSKLLLNPGGSLRYFVVGAAFNAVRILALGLAIGALGQARAGQDRGRRGHQPGTVLR
ncbi:MAG TPA: hypothetical protein VK903_15515 [Propionicimonas sp.]|nr:hypothetical protein [Propionicimonas sp.]